MKYAGKKAGLMPASKTSNPNIIKNTPDTPRSIQGGSSDIQNSNGSPQQSAPANKTTQKSLSMNPGTSNYNGTQLQQTPRGGPQGGLGGGARIMIGKALRTKGINIKTK